MTGVVLTPAQRSALLVLRDHPNGSMLYTRTHHQHNWVNHRAALSLMLLGLADVYDGVADITPLGVEVADEILYGGDR